MVFRTDQLKKMGIAKTIKNCFCKYKVIETYTNETKGYFNSIDEASSFISKTIRSTCTTWECYSTIGWGTFPTNEGLKSMELILVDSLTGEMIYEDFID